MTTTKRTSRIIAIFLVIVFSLSLAMSASARTVSTSSSKTKIGIVTCGDKVLGKTSKITIKNTGSDPIKVTFTKISGCKVYRSTGAGFSAWSSIVIYSGNSASINIRTSFGNSGNVQFTVENMLCGRSSYTVTGTNYQIISRLA